ncbi:MAG: class I SAM-dependent methyltransferase [Chloroflexi bacterium]|nr:class I SAM-dependent methyltransferase [Chloroflexota bacterium]
MTIDFHAPENRASYAQREAHPDWAAIIKHIVDPVGKRVADVGCGGGIYTRAWAGLGASEVAGIDFSEPALEEAAARSQGLANVSYRTGTVEATGLGDASVDVVFERAVVHHVAGLDDTFTEAYRVLAPGGLYIIQDRTMDDVRLPASPEHLRGYLFERFPRLLDVEAHRRPQQEAVEAGLHHAGFERVTTRTVWETRQVHESFDALAADLRARTGRSILHELTDADIAELIELIRENIPPGAAITEKDRWTLWWGMKPSR